jgi:hypothetical protein
MISRNENGGASPTASSMRWCHDMPYGVDIWGDYLIVADTANSRLLAWKKRESILLLQNAEADGVWGQDSFISKSENKTFGLSTRQSLNWCYGIKSCGKNMVVSNSGNDRVLIW